MEQVFINFTNHPSATWEEKQKRAAEQYGRILDLPFPAVEADGDEAYIQELAEHYMDSIEALEPDAVLCQGEFCLTYQIVSSLKEKGILVLAACSERCVEEKGDRKEVKFRFQRFRSY